MQYLKGRNIQATYYQWNCRTCKYSRY